jgi:uncharacterized membrane protein/protein-disulfide isomerase
MSSTTRWVIVALSLVGLGFAGASTWVHYRLLTDPTYVSPCDVSATFNCTQVYLSRYGSVAGVPVALGGLVWFGLTALIAGFARPVNGESSAAGYLLALGIIGLATVLYLAYVSFAVLGTGCLLCIGTYAGVVGIFTAALMSRPVALANLPARLGSDLRAAVAQPLVLVCAVLYLTASLGAVALFPGEDAAARQAAAAPAATASEQLDFATAWAQQPRHELGVDPEGASVVVVKWNDFECPSCRQAEAYYKSAFDKFAVSHPGAVKYVVKDWPLDAACNFHMMSTIRGHEAACDAAAAARMAKDRGKYQEMVDWIYANQAVSQADLRAAAQRILGVTDFDREYAQKLPEIRKDIADGGVLNINSTPTYFINGVRLPGGFPLQSFEMAITLEIEAARQRAQAQ